MLSGRPYTLSPTFPHQVRTPTKEKRAPRIHHFSGSEVKLHRAGSVSASLIEIVTLLAERETGVPN